MRDTTKILTVVVVLAIGIQQVWAHAIAIALRDADVTGYQTALQPRVVKQPFVFNHALHVKHGWKCLACHGGADSQAVAGVPTTKECATCHKAESVDKPMTRKVAAMAARGENIQWVRVYRVPDYVYFSHRRHVSIAKLQCTQCHGDMKDRTTPVDHQITPFRMSWCRGCHLKRHASTDCAACHK